MLLATVACQFMILSHIVKIGAHPMCMLNYQIVVLSQVPAVTSVIENGAKVMLSIRFYHLGRFFAF